MLAEELTKCIPDPSRFNETILCRGSYWSKQEEICQSLIKYPITVVKAANGVGKSHAGSGILLWYGACHPNSRSVVAAPTQDQLRAVLWAELRDAYESATKHGRHLGGKFQDLTLMFGEKWGIEGWGQGKLESKSGRHAEKLFAMIEEASGVGAEIHGAIDSLNPLLRLYIGNPLHPEGKFYELAENSAGNPNVNVIKITAFDSPHIHLTRSPWGMADATFLENCRHEYGEESLWWKSHILAEFPDELQSTLLPIAWLHAASLIVHRRCGPVRLGVDIGLGNGGDESAIVARDDNGVIGAWWSNKWGLEKLAEMVALKAREFEVKPENIVFDATGLGADFANRLKAVGLVGCRDYMGSRGGGEKYGNLRSAAAWLVRRRFDPNRTTTTTEASGLVVPQAPFALPQHLLQHFRPELQGLRYQLDNQGRIALEAKDEFIKRLKHSPNFLDALIMSFAYPHG